MLASEIDRVAVIGAGQMGSGIAEVCAAAGATVYLSDRDEALARRGRDQIARRLERAVARGKQSAEDVAALLARIEPGPEWFGVERAALVIEAAPEHAELKASIYRELGQRTVPAAILASNTSSLSITALGRSSGRAEQVVGLHFMNPVPVMKLVELVQGTLTSSETLATARAFAKRLGKEVILSQDRPGFLVNRILIPLLNEACFALEHGVGSREDIDQGARLGLAHPLGPLELADLIGLDTVLAIAEVLEREFGDPKYRPAPLLRNLVTAGLLGRKTGRGFYVYDADGKKRAEV